EVLAVASSCFASHALAKASFVRRKPCGLSFAEAAAIPIVFMTAKYALEHKAELAPGEKVLIHAAAGGTGLAAIQIAQLAGAEVLATAGSDAKRAHVQRLGVSRVMDSRSLA